VAPRWVEEGPPRLGLTRAIPLDRTNTHDSPRLAAAHHDELVHAGLHALPPAHVVVEEELALSKGLRDTQRLTIIDSVHGDQAPLVDILRYEDALLRVPPPHTAREACTAAKYWKQHRDGDGTRHDDHGLVDEFVVSANGDGARYGERAMALRNYGLSDGYHIYAQGRPEGTALGDCDEIGCNGLGWAVWWDDNASIDDDSGKLTGGAFWSEGTWRRSGGLWRGGGGASR